MKLLVIFCIFLVNFGTGLGDVCHFVSSDVQYLFYNIQNPENPIIIPRNDASLVKKTHFNKAKDTFLLVHGSGGNSSGPLVQKIKSAVAKAKMDVNLIGLDWLRFGNRNSKLGIYNCSKLLGKMVGDFLKEMAKEDGLDFSRLTMIAHSVAGAITADIGYNINKQARSTIGLETCSYKDSAKFVQCIHTGNANFSPLAHANYYPNGGGQQPHCPLPPDWACNHWRVIDYYVESLTTNKFVGRQCDNYNDFKAGKCNKNAVGVMGGLNPHSTVSGKFYLTTNDLPPYAKG